MELGIQMLRVSRITPCRTNMTMTHEPSASTARYRFLDASRGLAILGVLAVHSAALAGTSFPGSKYPIAGRNGVQLFFMLSAFTIFMTLERALSREANVTINFYTRRFLRIIPMFWVGILLYSFLPGREVYSHPVAIGSSDYLLTALLQHGWHPVSMNSVVPGGWSIAVEATFYLVAPLLFAWIKDWQGALSFLLLTLLGCMGGNHILHALASRHLLFAGVDQEVMDLFYYRWIFSQLPVFACGILAFRLWQILPATFLSKRNGWLLLITAAVLLNASIGGGGRPLIPEQLWFALGFLLLLLSLAVHPAGLLVNAATCFLGRVSYSFYLLHFVVLEGVVRLLSTRPGLQHGLPAFLGIFLLSLLLTTPCAYFTFTLIEKPFVAIGSRFIKRGEAAAARRMRLQTGVIVEGQQPNAIPARAEAAGPII